MGTRFSGTGNFSGLLDENIVFVQQSGNVGAGEAGFFNAVRFRVDREIAGGAEIRLFQVGITENGTAKITVGETSLGKICFREIHLLKSATDKLCVLEL